MAADCGDTFNRVTKRAQKSASLENLQVPLPVSRSKRPFEETEEGNQPDSKRWCSASPHLASPSNGLAPSSVHLWSTSGYCDDSDVDDSLLEPSYGENLDSPTYLSREEEDRLLADNLIGDLETSSCAVESGPSAPPVGGVCVLASDNLTQHSRALEEGKMGTRTEPFHLAGPSACKKTSVCPESENDLSKGSQNQAGLDLGSMGPLLPEAASVRLEKENCVPEVLEKGSGQAGGETNAGGKKPSVGRASTGQKEPGGEKRSSFLGYTGGELDSGESTPKAAPSSSSCVGDRRENHSQDPCTRETKRPRRICIQETDLELSKKKYVSAVLNHACCQEPVIGEVNEMLALMQRVASEYRGYSSQHTTDLTVRNYAQRSKSATQTFSLSQWVDRSGRGVRRFESVPEIFQRSPIPS